MRGKNSKEKKVKNSSLDRKIFTNNSVFYKHLIDLTPEAIVIHSEGKLVYLNPTALKLIGARNLHEVIGKSVMDFIHPDSVPFIQERIKKLLTKKKVGPFAVEKFIDLNGKIFIAETKAVPFDFQGKSAILAILRNITDKKVEEDKQKFLNEISKLLSSSIDYKTTIQNIIKSIVPTLADYSRLVIVGEGDQINDVISYHSDPKKLEDVEKLYESYRNKDWSTHGIDNMISSGKPEIMEKIDFSMEIFQKDRHLREIVKTLGLVSYMGVPLKIHGKIIGALTFSSIQVDKVYTKNDLTFVEEVARRIAYAIENARLYEQAQRIIETEQRLAAIVSYSDDAIISKNLNGIINTWNKAAEKVFGYTQQEAIGQHIKLIIPKNLWSEEKEIIRNIKQGKHIDHYETVRLRKDGEQIFVSLSISPIKNEQGKIVGASKIVRDVTEKKKNENELTHLASLVESTSDAIWSRTLDGRIISWNKGAEIMYGYTSEEAVGKDVNDLVVPSENQDEPNIITKRILTGEYIHNFETVRVTREGKKIDVSMTISPVKDPQGKIVGISAIVRNVSDQKEQEKLKDEFISIASHELKTPITSMKMFLDILGTYLEEKNDESIKYVNRIKDQANKMRDLVNDLLDISRISTGKLRFNEEEFYLEELLIDIIEGIQPAAKRHKLIFKNSFQLPVYADKFRIYQVITNLLNNAIKYSPKGDRIIITTKKVKGDVVVSIKDYGIGIAKNEQKKIFEKLYQVADSEEKTFPGLGMGLYISNEIIKRHNGRLWVKSKKREGSTFYFSLPLQEK